jgi:hypothetical protein
MCCSPEHIGPPPEWYHELADTEPSRRLGPRRMAEGLAALASAIHDEHQRGSGPGRRAVSTEGGQGRALPHHGNRPAELAEGSAVADTGAEPVWVQRPQRSRP